MRKNYKTILVLSIALIALTACRSTIKGDVNGDGKIDMDDANIVLLNGNDLDKRVADMNGDGKVDENDAEIIMEMWVHGGKSDPRLEQFQCDCNENPPIGKETDEHGI